MDETTDYEPTLSDLAQESVSRWVPVGLIERGDCAHEACKAKVHALAGRDH